MDMTGEQVIAAPRQAVWEALNDPEILRQAIPGCESVEKLSDSEFVAQVVAKVGPVKAKFKGKVALSDLDPPNSYTIQGEGQGGAAGFGKGGAKVNLTDVAEGTLLRYTVNASVGGKMAQIGSRLIDATARKMADEFFSKFNQIVAGSAVAAAAPAGDAPQPVIEAEHPIAPTHAPLIIPARRFPPWIWAGGLIALIIVALILYAQNG